MKRTVAALLLILTLGASACGVNLPMPAATDTPVLPQVVIYTASATVTSTATLFVTPSLAATLTPVPTGTRTRAERIDLELTFSLIYMQDATTCSFQTQPILSGIDRTGNVPLDVTLALNTLFGLKQEQWGEMSNPQSASQMYVDEVLQLDTQRLVVYLGGNPGLSADACLNRQVREQVFATIRDACGGMDVTVWINSVLFDDIFLPG